jgi:SAM-dependent methyltransferase
MIVKTSRVMTTGERFLDRIDFRDAYLDTRAVKAEKILRILRDQIGDLARICLLDVGCSRGQITERLAQEVSFAVGLEYDAERQLKERRFHSVRGDGCQLPLVDSHFDVVVINHILEHVTSPEGLMDEVWRVLKPGGIAYLACPNRLSIVEPHYRLPFLSWLPRRWADRYVRMLGRGDRYRDHLPSFWRVMQLSRRFRVIDQTVDVLKRPERYLLGDQEYDWKVTVAARLPRCFLKLLVPFVPVWILILKKEESRFDWKTSSTERAVTP